jgi:choline dehydrogenase-like flavoprotein
MSTSSPSKAPRLHPISIPLRTWRSGLNGQEPSFDAIVVGSGYGGAVAALRLAEKGYQVLVLERGSEYLPGELPNDMSVIPMHVRWNIPGHATPGGRPTGLMEFSVGQGVAAVTANGVGGGSLFNAGVLMKPDDEVFKQAQWPIEFQHNVTVDSSQPSDQLRKYFKLAWRQLKGPPGTTSHAKWQTKRNAAFQIIGQQLADSIPPKGPTPTDLTINLDACTGCGDCVSGCNIPGAKMTLSETYLSKAMETGQVQIVNGAEVYRFEQTFTGEIPTGWKVWVFGTDAAQHFPTHTRLMAGQGDESSTVMTLSAPILVIAAGTLGSTQLLQRSEAQSYGKLRFSSALGTRFSTNGDSVSVLVTPDRSIDSVGQGSGSGPTTPNRPIGPTIRDCIDLRNPQLPLDERLVLQEAAIPGLLRRIFSELTSFAYTNQMLDHWTFGSGIFTDSTEPHGVQVDPVAASDALIKHTQMLLVMGHDHSPGRMVWLQGDDCSAMVLPDPKEFKTFLTQQKKFDSLKKVGVHLHNPLWQILSGTASQLVEGEKVPSMATTVHPLGGCPMGDDPSSGVVNHRGQVWVRDPGQDTSQLTFIQQNANRPQLYEGLYVMDGSIIPTSLGCNPLLTITAIAERACSYFPSMVAKGNPLRVQRSMPRPYRQAAFIHTAVDAVLRESLQLSRPEPDVLHPFTRLFNKSRPTNDLNAWLHIEFRDADLALVLQTPKHEFEIASCRLAIGEDPGLVYELDGKASDASTFQLLPIGWWTRHPKLDLARNGAELITGVLGAFAILGLAILSACQSQWWFALGALALFMVWCLAYLLLGVYFRTALTWWVSRGQFEIWRFYKEKRSFHVARFFSMVLGLAKGLHHASEKRVVRYHIHLVRAPSTEPSTDKWPEKITLNATKTVMYRGTAREILSHFSARFCRWVMRDKDRHLGEIPPITRSYWEQVTEADVCLTNASDGSASVRPPLLEGRFKMGLESLFSRKTAQLGTKVDGVNALLTLGGYATLFLRYGLKTRLYDFRLPNYSHLPFPDDAKPYDYRLRLQQGGYVVPRLHWIEVPRGTASSDTGLEDMSNLRLRLMQYMQGGGIKEALPTLCVDDSGQAIIDEGKVAKVKVVVLLHAFGQSSLTYVFKDPETDPVDAPHEQISGNMAEYFYRKGYEVWLFDHRLSTSSGYAERKCTIDMIGQHDIPEALMFIHQNIRARMQKVPDYSKIEVFRFFAFAQCLGAASLWMASLSGRTHETVNGKLIPLLAGAVFSQVHAINQGSATAKAKLWIPTSIRGFVDFIAFGVRGRQAWLPMQILDRFLNTLPLPENERGPRLNEDGVASCRRVRYLESELFEAKNLSDYTVNHMHQLFGPANLTTFVHARRFLTVGQLVDEDGVRRYVNQANLNEHLHFPISLMHGENNQLFDVSGADLTYQWLGQSPYHRKLQTMDPARHLLQKVPNYGHLDGLIGKNAARDVFPNIERFFDWAAGH